MSRFQYTNRNLELLEPYEWKRSRTVLRREGASNRPDLVDYCGRTGRVLAYRRGAIHPDGLRVRRVRPGKRCHGMDQDQQGQGGRGRQNERERIPARPGGTAHGPDRAAGCGHLRRLYQ